MVKFDILFGIVAALHHEVDVVFFDTVPAGDLGSVGNHFANVAAPGYTSYGLLHRLYGPALVAAAVSSE